jgi:hypothetical protein
MKNLLKEVTEESTKRESNRTLSLECSRISKQVGIVHSKWSQICQQVKQLYSKLSIALAAISGRSPSPVSSNGSLINSDRSLSPEDSDMKTNDIRHHQYSQLDSVVLNTRPPSAGNQVAVATMSHVITPPQLSKKDKSLDRFSFMGGQYNHQQVEPSKSQTLPSGFSSSSLSPPRYFELSVSLSDAGPESSPACRLTSKLQETSKTIDSAESFILRSGACILNSKDIKSRLNSMREYLTILDLQFDELNQLKTDSEVIPSSPTAFKKTTACGYTPLELRCCKENISQLHQSVRDLQLVCNEDICNVELILELVEQFEEKISASTDAVSTYQRIVHELRSCSLEGNYQPWTTAGQSLDMLAKCNEELESLKKFLRQLLSLEPHYNGCLIKDEVSSIEGQLNLVSSEANTIILSAIGHRETFAQETLAILDNWLERTEEELNIIKKNKSVPSLEYKQTMTQEIGQHIASLELTSGQLDHILKLSSCSLLRIPQLENIRETIKKISCKRKKLDSLSTDVEGFKPSGELMASVSKQPPRNITPLYIEVETKPRTANKLQPVIPLPVYSEIILQPQSTSGHADDNKSPILPPPLLLASPIGVSSPIEIQPFVQSPTSIYEHTDYDTPRPSSVKAMLLECICREYSQMAGVVEGASVFSAFQQLNSVLATLADCQAKRDCKVFLSSVHGCQVDLISIQKAIDNLDVSKSTFLSSISDQKRSCFLIGNKLDGISQQLAEYNMQTVNLHSSLASLPLNETQINQALLMIESELFDVCCTHYNCQMTLRDTLQLLRGREKDMSSLQTDIDALTQCLNDALDLLAKRDSIMSANEYLTACKVIYYNIRDGTLLYSKDTLKEECYANYGFVITTSTS